MKMKRNLIALAVGSAASVAMVAPAMAGDVTVYGRAQVEISSISYEDEVIAGAEDGIDVADNAQGRLGFKASEDLGNGWKGLAKFEFKADTSDNIADTSGGAKTSLSPREAMVGLKGSMVQIELGTLKSAYKYAGGVKYDPFVSTALEARNNFGMTGKPGTQITDLATAVGIPVPAGTFNAINKFGHNGFIDNHVAVQGGSGPIKARLTYGPEEGDGSYSLSVKYNQNNIEAFVAAVDSGDLLAAGAVTYSSTKFGGQFKTGPHKISLQYEMPELEDLSWTNLYIDYQMKMGKNTFDVTLGQEDYDDCNGDGCSPSFMRIGVIHKFTKTTRIFGGYRSSDSDGIDYREDVVTVGLRKDF